MPSQNKITIPKYKEDLLNDKIHQYNMLRNRLYVTRVADDIESISSAMRDLEKSIQDQIEQIEKQHSRKYNMFNEEPEEWYRRERIRQLQRKEAQEKVFNMSLKELLPQRYKK